MTSHGSNGIGSTFCHQRLSLNKQQTMILDLTSLQMVAFDTWQQSLLLRHSTISGTILPQSTTPSLAASMGDHTTDRAFSKQQPSPLRYVGPTFHTQQTSCHVDARDRLTSRSKTSTCGQSQDRSFVQRFPERDSSSLSLPSLPSPSSSLYPPQSKFGLDPSPSHLISYGISYSQMKVLLSLHRLTFCHLFSDSLDWLTQLVTPNDTHGIFFHNSHWYAYFQDRHKVHVLLKDSNDPLRTFLNELTYLDSSLHTLSFCFYYAPPTPRGLCGLVAISSLCCLLGRQTPLPVLQLSGYTLHWKYSKAVRELHTHYASTVASTSKHFSCGPIGFMDNANPDDSYNDPFTITDTMSPQIPSLHPDTFSIPLIPPNFSHEPITYNLYLTDSELVDFLDIQTVVDQRFVYFHFDQSLSMNYFHLKDTTTPPQLFSDKWNEFYPCYPQSCIKKILLWDNFLQTWSPIDFKQIDRLPQTNHLRIHFHTRWLHVDFPLIKRSFRIEITPVWTVQHIIDSLQTTLGHSSTSLILTQQGRTLPQYFDPWRALPSYTLKPLTVKIPPTLSIHQGRQLAKPLRYCTCNTLCATTHELTKRTITSFGNPQINVCIFRHPVNNNLFVLPICSITTPTHIHARFLPYNAVFWILVVNDTFVSMDSILIHYGTPVALEFYELPLTRGVHTDTLYGTSLFHLRIQDPGTMTYRPYKRITLQPNPHLHRFVDIALIIEPTLTVEELELTLENFLRLNLDCLQPPRNQPVGTLVRNTVQQTYQVLVGEDPYAIRHNLYNPLFPKMATRPYPPNHDYWTISDQFCSFLQSVPKTSETTFRDVFYDHFRYDHFDYTSIRSIVFNNETWHLYDFVPITSCDRIVYVLSPIRLDLHLLEINTHVYLTVSPLTQISHLKQLLETYTHISKHHNILPYSDDDFVTILPQPTFIGFHPTDRSDSATLASQLTDLSTLTGSADPSLLALEDDPDPFLHIPFHYWVTDVDIDFVFSNLLQDDIHWFPPLSFRQGYAYLCSDSTFLTTFVFQSHWYACFFSAPDQEQRELDSHLLITRDSLPTAFLFVPPGFSSSQKHELLQNIATLLPICNIDYVYATLSLPGLCGITLIQCLFNWMSSHTSVPLPLRLRCLTYSNFDFTHLSLFFQSTELRRRHPLASQQFTFRAGAPSTDPNPTSNTISDTTSPSPSTAAIPTLSGTTSYEVIQSCQDQEASHSLLSATQLAQFPQVMRHLVILQLPPTIGVHTLQNLFPENKPPLPPTGKIHVLLMAQEAVWRKTAILPVTFTHAQRLQYLLPGFRSTLYEQLDHNIHNAWISLPKLEATTPEPYIQYRIQFKKFLVPVHIQQTRHSCLLEVWPWYTIQDVVQLLQTILHLPADALTPQNHPRTTHLATISRRLLLVFNYQRTPTLLNYSLDFPLPPEVLINPRCWCHTVCTHTILTSINTERTRQSLYLNLLFVILPTSRQLVLINQCQAGTFKQLLTYLLPQRSNIQQHFVLGDLTAFPLHFNLPTPEQISYAVFVHLPRHILRFPTIDDHISLFRYAAESEFQHPDLFPITINWHVSTTNPPLCRQVFTLPYLSLGDLLRAIKNFCGTHHVVNLTPDLPPSTLLSNTPQPVVFTVTHLSHYENDHYSIETLEVYFNDNLSILPRDKWFTEHDIVIFQNYLRRTYTQLAPVSALDFSALCLQSTDTTWATAAVYSGTWLPVYYDSVLTTLIIGIPIRWLTSHKDTIVNQLKSTFTHVQTRPLPGVPEGYCGPLAIANLYFWSGYDQCTSPLTQLQKIARDAWSRPHRSITNQDAKLIAGGPKPIDATRPPELTPDIIYRAFMLTFFPHTRDPQAYSLVEAQMANRITLKRYSLFDENHFRPLYVNLVEGIPDEKADDVTPISPYISLLFQCFSVLMDADHNPTDIFFLPLHRLEDDKPYNFELHPTAPSQFSSHHLDLLFRFLFPHNRFHWVHPEHFMTFGAQFAYVNYKWVTCFIAQQHWIPVIKLLPNFPSYHFLIPRGIPVSLVAQRFLELTNIATNDFRSRGNFFPSTPPGLCGPAATLALMRQFKFRHFSPTKYSVDQPKLHLLDYSRQGIFEILLYVASLDTLFPADPSDIFSFAGGHLSRCPTLPTQEDIQRTLLRNKLIQYMTPLAPTNYLSDADIKMFIPGLMRKYRHHDVYVISGPCPLLSPLSQYPNCVIFYTTPQAWQIYHKTTHQIIQYIIDPGFDVNTPHLFPPWTDLECVQFLLRPHSTGWNGINLLSYILNGQQTLEHSLDLFSQICSYRTLPLHQPLFTAGSTFPDSVLSQHVHPLPRSLWMNNLQLDIALSLTLSSSSYFILPTTRADQFNPPPPTTSWIVVLNCCDHWFPFLFHHGLRLLFVDFPHFCPNNIRYYFRDLFQQYQLSILPHFALPTGWCGLTALTFLHKIVCYLPTSHVTTTTPFSPHCDCLCWGGTWDTILDTNSVDGGSERSATIAATVPFDLQQDSTITGDGISLAPGVAWQASESFSCPLTPHFIQQCQLPDLTKYAQWNDLDFVNYDSYLTHTFTCLPFTHTHYSQLGLWDAFESLLQQHLSSDVQHSLLGLMHQAIFQTYCPFTRKLYYSTSIHNFVGIVHEIYPSVTLGYDLYALLLRPSCPSADYCNHSGKSCFTTGILLVLAPTKFTTQYHIHPSSSLVILQCTILSLYDLLWTAITYPPQSNIAFTYGPTRQNGIIDLFAGIGTWTLASQYLYEHRMLCSVDNDLPALQTHAKTFSTSVISLHDAFTQCPTQSFLLHHDVQDFRLLPLFSILSPSLLCASPPCPPWSKAGTLMGLNRPEGLLTLYCLFYAYYLQIPIVFEQVAAFLEHPHYIIFQHVAQLLGLTLRFIRKTNASQYAPISRNRVLVCCDPAKNTQHTYLSSWNSPSTIPTTLRLRHFLPPSHLLAQHSALRLSKDELRILSDPLLVPSWYPFPSAHPLQRRTRHLGDVLGAIMSLYPKQTQLPINLLRSNGLFTELVALADHTVRRFHPLEWAAALGWPPILCLPSNLEDAWHQIGNTLSPHQALYALCSALSTPSFTYDFYSLVTRLQQDSMDLISNAYHCQDSYLQPVHLHRLFPHTPIIPPITSFQASLFFAPRNILLRTPTTQIVLTYQQHETLYTFTLRHHLIPTLLRTPLYNPIHPSITIQQLHLQHRFLCYDRDISPSLYTRVPQDYLQFQLQSLRGSFYLIDDSQTSVCIVNWTLGKATGSYHTNARTLQAIIHEWYPLDAFFQLTPQEGDPNFATGGRLPHHQKVHFTLSVPRTFYLRSLRVNAPDIALQVTMAVSLTMDYLYYLLLDKLSLDLGSFTLYSLNNLLTKDHLCRNLLSNTIHLFYNTDGPQFPTPPHYTEIPQLLSLQTLHTQHTPSPLQSPDRPRTYQYLLTGALGRNFVILDSPTLPSLKSYLLRHFGTNDFIYVQNNQLLQLDLTQHSIELRTPLQGGSSLDIKGLFGKRTIYPTQYTLPSLIDCLNTLFSFPSFYCIQQGKPIKYEINPDLPVYILGRLRGGVGNVPPPKNVHQTTPPPNTANKLRRRDGTDSPPRELELHQGSSSEEQPVANLSTDEKLLLILKETKANRRESKRITHTVRSLETEVSSSSRRLDSVEEQIGQLQGEIHQLRVSPDAKFDPASRRPSVDSTISTPHLSPDLVNKKLRTLYFRGFPIDTRDTLLHWMQQQDLPQHEELYTIGSPSDTVAVLFNTETDLWTFLRKWPNNKWILYGSAQIYIGLDNQIRGQNPEHTKAIRKLFRACIEILKEKYPDADVSQTHIYRNYNRGIVKVKNGSEWEEVAHWDFRVSKLIFATDGTAYEQLWKDLMR